MGRYALNLPMELKHNAEQLATAQGVSLNQFILWAVAEKVGGLQQRLDDPAFPHITYRRGASGQPTPMVRGSGIRVQTLVVAHRQWQMTPAQVAAEYGLMEARVGEALAFYRTHQAEIDQNMQMEAGAAGGHG